MQTSQLLSAMRRRSLGAEIVHKTLGCTSLSALLLACSSAPAGSVRSVTPAAHTDATSETTVFRDVRVFDGLTSLIHRDVVVRGGRIVAMEETGQTSGSASAQIVEGAGLTLLPGLIDSHAHVFSAVQLAQAALFGVTTVLDMGTDEKLVPALREAATQGPVSDLRSALTFVTAPGGHGTEYGFAVPTLARESEAPAFVEGLVNGGADYIKLIYDDGRAYGVRVPTLSRASLDSCITSAHAQHKLAIVHVSSEQEAHEAIDAGADGLAHLFADTIGSDGFVTSIVAHRSFVIPTLSVLAALARAQDGPDLSSDPHLVPYLDAASQQQLRARFPVLAPRLDYAHAVSTLRTLHASRVTLLAGTDAPNPGTAFGASLHGELELLVKAGLAPTDALAAATSSPASRFNLEDRGRIAPGLLADLLLVRGDPTTDILATRDVVSVWKAGKVVDREAVRRNVASENAARPNRPAPSEPLKLGDGLVSDFEGGAPTSKIGSGWVATTDGLVGGKSHAEIQVRAVDENATKRANSALHIAGEVNAGSPFPWAGALFLPGVRPQEPANLSHAKGLSFSARGDGKTYRVMFFSSTPSGIPPTLTFVAERAWKTFSFSFAELTTLGLQSIVSIAVVAGPSPGAFQLEIDDVRLSQ